MSSPFPTVADAIQVEVNDYKTSEEKLMRLKAAMVRVCVYGVGVCVWCGYLVCGCVCMVWVFGVSV